MALALTDPGVLILKGLTNRHNMVSSSKNFAKNALPLVLLADVGSVVFNQDLRKFKRLTKISVMLLLLRLSEVQGSLRINKSLLLPAFLAELLLNCFSWQFSLYLLIRQLTFSFKTEFLYSAKSIFSIHLVSWYLIGVQAEKVEPSYISMWAQSLPEYNKRGRDHWLEEYGSKASSSEYYKTQQVSKERLFRFPINYLKSITFQLPFCVALYLIGFVKRLNKQMTPKQVLKRVFELLRKSVVSSAVLGMLPYSMCAFPCLYSNLFLPLFKEVEVDEKGMRKIKRNIPLHVTFAAAISTFVFLQEPRSRMKMMVGYMIWRVIEALLRTHIVSKSEAMKKRLLAASFTALTAHWC